MILRHQLRAGLLLLMLSLVFTVVRQRAAADVTTRLIVLTDLGAGPDDEQSLVRGRFSAFPLASRSPAASRRAPVVQLHFKL